MKNNQLKRLLLMLVLGSVAVCANAQELKVKLFRQMLTDLSASTNVRKDLNDEPCALVKVQLVDPGATFKGSIIGTTEYKVNQYWVYMPAGTKKLQVNHPKYLPLDIIFGDYGITKLESKCTYVLTLAMPNADKVKINCNVGHASLYMDGGKYMGDVSSYYDISNGVHNIRLTADGYYDYEGKIIVSQDNKTFDISMNAKPQIPMKKYSVGGVSFQMVMVEGGTFTMGATSEQQYSDLNEKPVHDVKLTEYYIGETEVTQALWEAVMGSNPSEFKGDKTRPVELVSWDECQQFIEKLNQITGRRFRLPTEAEWEFAARGGIYSFSYQYPGSNILKDVGWVGTSSFVNSHPVKKLQPNELGLYDMGGNVSEWCSDFYGSYSNTSQTNPRGPSSGLYRVIRGGSWDAYTKACRCSSREFNKPTFKERNLGLRLAL